MFNLDFFACNDKMSLLLPAISSSVFFFFFTKEGSDGKNIPLERDKLYKTQS